MKKHKISDFEALSQFCAKISQELGPRQIILLNGPMASGKTTFVKYFIEALGGSITSSPTYAIHQSYSQLTSKLHPQADHLDLYRLKNNYDLESTGFWDLFEEDKGLILIEWADRLEGEWWPASWSVLSLRFSVQDENRFVEVS